MNILRKVTSDFKSHTDKSGLYLLEMRSQWWFSTGDDLGRVLLSEYWSQSWGQYWLKSRELGVMVINYKALSVNSMQDNHDFTLVGRDKKAN